jgi:hypothetical protein
MIATKNDVVLFQSDTPDPKKNRGELTCESGPVTAKLCVLAIHGWIKTRRLDADSHRR